ncbi:hypothetical protein JW877_02190 [bacterium]|nr:hypothetical protein [bacterium]
MKSKRFYRRVIRPFKNNLIYLFARALIWYLNLISRQKALRFGALGGRILFRLLKRTRIKTIRNIQKGLSSSIADASDIALDCFISAGKNLVDSIRMASRSGQEVLKLIEIRGLEHFVSLYEQGSGIIVITGHLGCFEMVPAFFTYSGYKVAVIAREMYDPRLDRRLLSNRERAGIKVIEARNSPKTLLRLLRQGYAVGFLMDLESRAVSCKRVNFLNHWVKVPVGPVKLAIHSGLPMLPMNIYRKPDDRFVLEVHPPMQIIPGNDREEQLRANMDIALKALEKMIRAKPSEWVWMNSKWDDFSA